MDGIDDVELASWMGSQNERVHALEVGLREVREEVKKLPEAIERRVAKVFDGSKANTKKDGHITWKDFAQTILIPLILGANSIGLVIVIEHILTK